MTLYEKLVKVMSPLVKIYHRLDVYGLENIPPEGEGFILAPNHSGWFGWDAAVVGSVLKDRMIHWLAWSYEKEFPLWDAAVRAFDVILYNNEKPFPYEKATNEMLNKGEIVGIFPEGNSNPMGKWYRLRPFFPGFIRLSVMSGAPIVPVAVAGLEEASPILWGKEEEKEPIKTMIALPVVFPTKAVVHFGEPMNFKINTADKEAMRSAAEKVQLEVLKLLKKYRHKAYAETFNGKVVVQHEPRINKYTINSGK